MKVHLYVPEEGTAPSCEAIVRMTEVPITGDFLHLGVLSPRAGPGASDRLFRVTSRTWYGNEPHLTVTRVRA